MIPAIQALTGVRPAAAALRMRFAVVSSRYMVICPMLCLLLRIVLPAIIYISVLSSNCLSWPEEIASLNLRITSAVWRQDHNKFSRCRGLCIDKSGDPAILPAMVGNRFSGLSAKSVVSRAGLSAVLAFWCLLSLASGANQALCLDLGGSCSPSAAEPTGPCHEPAPAGDSGPGCGSCVDILVPDDAAIGGCRPGRDHRPPAAAHPAGAAAGQTLFALKNAAAAAAAPLSGTTPLCPFPRTTVLRI